MAVVAAVGIYLVVRDLIRGYWTTRGARIEHYVLHSRFVHADLHEIRVVPRHHDNWTLVFLHGRSSSPSSFLSQSFFDALHGLGRRAPVVLLLDGGDHSYWHNRADGAWGSMVLDGAIPKHGRVAIGGISMGGYGAFELAREARRGRFCAVGGHSPAFWLSAGQTAPGAFDDAADFAAHDVFAGRAALSGIPVRIACGESDPFYPAVRQFLPGVPELAGTDFRAGGHTAALWRSTATGQLRFLAAALHRP